MSGADPAALLARAARFLQAQYVAAQVTFRAAGDDYSHTARFEWPGRVAVFWEGELQCRSAAGNFNFIESTKQDLRHAGIDRVRARALLEQGALALEARRPSVQRQMPGMRAGQPSYLVQFRWPGQVRVLSFASKAVLVESKAGYPADLSEVVTLEKPVDLGLWGDERDPIALQRARQRRRSNAVAGGVSGAVGSPT
jgi:hypothetical protein